MTPGGGDAPSGSNGAGASGGDGGSFGGDAYDPDTVNMTSSTVYDYMVAHNNVAFTLLVVTVAAILYFMRKCRISTSSVAEDYARVPMADSAEVRKLS